MLLSSSTAKSGSLAASLAIALAVAGTAALAQPSNPEGLDHGRLSSLGEICGSVMRVQPGQAQYDACVTSLSGAFAGLSQGHEMQAAHDACLDKGLKPGSADLAVCTLQSAQARPSDISLVSAAPLPGGSKSYFSVSNRDQMRREQLACAQLGLNPAGGAFDSCVAGLRSSLFAADNPSQ